MIGEAFESFNETCGAVVNLRPKGDKIGESRLFIDGSFGVTIIVLFSMQQFGPPITRTKMPSLKSEERLRKA